jgi:hypothetical protein
MRLFRSGSRVPASLGWLAAGAIGIAVVAGGAGYAIAQLPTGSLLDSLTRRAVAQEAPTPTTPAAARKGGPTAAGAPTAVGAANAANPRKPTGTVTQITPDPPSFTLQAADGTLTTYTVLPTTVFMAGRDRPYHFDLLKTGDTVVVRGGAQAQGAGQPAATASPQPAGAGNAAQAGKPRAAARADARAAGAAANNGEPIARIVVVRPAGEGGLVKNGQNGGAQEGGSDGAGQ